MSEGLPVPDWKSLLQLLVRSLGGVPSLQQQSQAPFRAPAIFFWIFHVSEFPKWFSKILRQVNFGQICIVASKMAWLMKFKVQTQWSLKFERNQKSCCGKQTTCFAIDWIWFIIWTWRVHWKTMHPLQSFEQQLLMLLLFTSFTNAAPILRWSKAILLASFTSGSFWWFHNFGP